MPKGADRDDPHKYLDPVALAKVRSLELQARRLGTLPAPIKSGRGGRCL
jgi:hypothetical protein